ncbi:retrovirus-related pol polyprotein from transposon TNT 1-94 [Tanacetum coccineum]|uniref:Retrovirus-related pol polyprotein from transposon TNT 1-94 n=1 Tax=Tanacetum coccineum TaxID=301880 RepID=A0ABQ5BBF4_9ASTR
MVPEMVIRSLESLCATFFWGDHENSKKLSWVKWSNTLASFDKGGLGVGSLNAFNKALLLKWRWHLFNYPNALWVQVIKAFHGKESSIDLGGCQTSGVWAKIVGTINHLHSSGIVPLSSIRFKVGDGSSIRLWKDTWLGDEPLYIRYNILFHLDNNKDCFIRQCILNGSWDWDWSRPITMSKTKTEFDNLILDIANMETDDLADSDSCVWSLSNDDSEHDSWSDSEYDAEDKTNDDTSLMAQSSNEVMLNSSHYSDNASSLDNDSMQIKYDSLCEISLKIINKNKILKTKRDLLEKEILELNEKIKKLERSKEVDIACKSCEELKSENAKLKETQVKFVKFDKSANSLREMLNNQKSPSCKIGLGFNSDKASTSGTKTMRFVGSSAEKGTDRSTIKVHGSTLPGSVCLGTCMELDEWIKDSGGSKHMTGNKSLFSTYKAYDGEQFRAFCDAQGITHNFSALRTPQSNGVVERKNMTLQEMSRTMLNEQSIPQKFLCNVVDTSTYILNRISIRPILEKTPYEIFRGMKPSLEYFKVFGSKCFILNTKDYLTKFEPKSYEGVFLGYSQNSKAYVVLNKHTMKVEESLNVIFDESPPPNKLSPLVDDDVGEEEAIRKNNKIVNINNEEDESIEVDEIVNIKEFKNHPLDQVIGNLNQRTLRSQAQNHKLVPLTISQSVIGTKWVFRNKLDENGIVSRNKARLVAQGYNQQESIDYDETYASIARLESIRILLAIACANDFKLYQMDVKSAFLNGFINEEVYVAQPPRFIDFQKPNYGYKHKKALYGLKQAPKAWYDRLKAFLIKHEYSMGMVDNTLFTKKSKSHLIIVYLGILEELVT